MDAFTVIVVDDESPARGLVREYLAAHADMRLVAECANGFEAVKAANTPQAGSDDPGCADAEARWL